MTFNIVENIKKENININYLYLLLFILIILRGIFCVEEKG